MSRILLARLDGVGDALVSVPLVAALRAAGHEVAALLTTRNAECFAPGALSARHIVERIPWPRHGSTPRSRARALEELRAARYDAALIASEEPEAYAYAKQAAIPVRVGFWNGFERPLKSLWIALQCTRVIHRRAALARVQRHEVEQLFDLGRDFVAGARPATDTNVLAPLVLDALPARGATLAIQCTAKWAAIGCEPAALARWCAQIGASRPAVLLASAQERAPAEAIAQRSGLALRTFESVREWMGAIAASAALLTPDTGAAHVAGMLGVPTIDVFARAHFEQQRARWRPWAAPHRVLSAPAPEQAAAFGTSLLVALDSLGFALPA